MFQMMFSTGKTLALLKLLSYLIIVFGAGVLNERGRYSMTSPPTNGCAKGLG